MTVGELVLELSDLPPDMPVVAFGEESHDAAVLKMGVMRSQPNNPRSSRHEYITYSDTIGQARDSAADLAEDDGETGVIFTDVCVIKPEYV